MADKRIPSPHILSQEAVLFRSAVYREADVKAFYRQAVQVYLTSVILQRTSRVQRGHPETHTQTGRQRARTPRHVRPLPS